VIGAATPIVLVLPQVINVRSVTVGACAAVVDPPAVPVATASAVNAVSADKTGIKAFLILPPSFLPAGNVILTPSSALRPREPLVAPIDPFLLVLAHDV
jgi:hypothetical protein